MVIVFTWFYPCGPLKWVDKLVTGTISMAHAGEKAKEATISEFRVRSRYMAVRLTWKARIPEEEQLTFEVHRSMVTPEGEYTLVTSIKGRPGTKTYRYIDKTVPVEENYFYKIVIPETKETFGPLQARPPFSLPST
jgi:hypothetical protein